MNSLYECEVAGCEWRNPNWRYGFAEAGATWAEHAAEHARRVHNHHPWRPMCNERRLSDGQLRGACLEDDGTDRDVNLPPGGSSTEDGAA